MPVLSRLLAVVCLVALSAVASLSITTGHAGDRAGAPAGRAHDHGTVSWRKDVAFRDVAFSLTHRLWADAPGQEGDAGRQELAQWTLSLAPELAEGSQLERLTGRM